MVGVYTHLQKCTKLANYVEGSEYPLVQIVKSAKEIRVYGLMSWARVLNKCGTTEDNNK